MELMIDNRGMTSAPFAPQMFGNVSIADCLTDHRRFSGSNMMGAEGAVRPPAVRDCAVTETGVVVTVTLTVTVL